MVGSTADTKTGGSVLLPVLLPVLLVLLNTESGTAGTFRTAFLSTDS